MIGHNRESRLGVHLDRELFVRQTDNAALILVLSHAATGQR
ncbi:hypothetical protein RBSWK_06560 [Rhodopirellula baltica SWK14]|uniref:Uncharacterized protein n=1 Tax=Rhodopirellula baltica SWK14 TaxID=993516 RepID=L7C652_RHOBT|nr:hypothetical protein RBSWK_06560 [Rhodopirellula baltica SWK14]